MLKSGIEDGRNGVHSHCSKPVQLVETLYKMSEVLFIIDPATPIGNLGLFANKNLDEATKLL